MKNETCRQKHIFILINEYQVGGITRRQVNLFEFLATSLDDVLRLERLSLTLGSHSQLQFHINTLIAYQVNYFNISGRKLINKCLQ